MKRKYFNLHKKKYNFTQEIHFISLYCKDIRIRDSFVYKHIPTADISSGFRQPLSS